MSVDDVAKFVKETGSLGLLAYLIVAGIPRLERVLSRIVQLEEAQMKAQNITVPAEAPTSRRFLSFLVVLLVGAAGAFLSACSAADAGVTGSKRALCHFGDIVCKGTRIICGEPDPAITDAPMTMPAAHASTLETFAAPKVTADVSSADQAPAAPAKALPRASLAAAAPPCTDCPCGSKTCRCPPPAAPAGDVGKCPP